MLKEPEASPAPCGGPDTRLDNPGAEGGASQPTRMRFGQLDDAAYNLWAQE